MGRADFAGGFASEIVAVGACGAGVLLLGVGCGGVGVHRDASPLDSQSSERDERVDKREIGKVARCSKHPPRCSLQKR